METDFTPIQSLAGGALIGLSAVMLMATNGRIAGISGIVAKLLPGSADKDGMKTGLMFVAGLLLALPLALVITGFMPTQTINASLSALAIAGLLVGFGAAKGSGCTSGHGVCGISRLSVRSLVATATFMASAFITVFALRHIIGG